LYRIDNEMLAEHWDAVEATAFPNRKFLNSNLVKITKN
jgi:predicted SnoaL-like aldol condensation-catalyzing enzyme